MWLLSAIMPTSTLLPNRDGHPMTRTNVAQRLALAVAAATPAMPGLRDRHISPHTVRHTTAMHLLQSGEPIEGIALWLGQACPLTFFVRPGADQSLRSGRIAAAFLPFATSSPGNLLGLQRWLLTKQATLVPGG